jgi:hypothetical protein
MNERGSDFEKEESVEQPSHYKNVFLYFDPEEVDDDDNDSSIDEDIVAERFQLFQPDAENLNLVTEETGAREAAVILQNYKQSGKLYLRPDQIDYNDLPVDSESLKNERKDRSDKTTNSTKKKEPYTPNRTKTSYTVVNSSSDVEEVLAAEYAPSSPIVKIFYEERGFNNDISLQESPIETSPFSGRPIYNVLRDTISTMRADRNTISKVGHQRIVQRMKKRLEYTRSKNPKSVHNDESIKRAIAVKEVVDKQKRILEGKI